MSGLKNILAPIIGHFLRRWRGNLSCRELEDFIAAYDDGELSEWQRARFEKHIRRCRSCRDYLRAYRLSRDLAVGTSDDLDSPAPDDVPDEIIRGILAALRKPEP